MQLSQLESQIKKSIYYKNLTSSDFTKILFVIDHSLPSDEKHLAKKKLLTDIISLIDKNKFYESYNFTGKTYLNYTIDRKNIEDIKIIILSVIIFIILLLTFIYRNIFRITLLFSSAIFCLAYSFFIFFVTNQHFTVINITLPILIIVIALSDSIFITHRADTLIPLHQLKNNFIINLIKKTWLPCFLTSLTTGIAFFSFYYSDVLPVKELGKISLPIIFGAYFIIMLSNYLLIYYFFDSYKKTIIDYQKTSNFFTCFNKIVNNILQKNYKKIIIISSIFIITISFGLHKLYTETNFLKIFFKYDSPDIIGYHELDNYFSGSGAVELVINNNNLNYEDIDDFNFTQNLREDIEKLNLVRETNSYHDVVAMTHDAFGGDKIYPNNSKRLSSRIIIY